MLKVNHKITKGGTGQEFERGANGHLDGPHIKTQDSLYKGQVVKHGGVGEREICVPWGGNVTKK